MVAIKSIPSTRLFAIESQRHFDLMKLALLPWTPNGTDVSWEPRVDLIANDPKWRSLVLCSRARGFCLVAILRDVNLPFLVRNWPAYCRFESETGPSMGNCRRDYDWPI